MPKPLLQDPSLTWGVLSFVAPGSSDSPFEIEAVAAGTHFGNPQPVIEAVRSLLIEGALMARTGTENREIPIRLRISANDGESMAEAEAALVAQERMDQPPPLVWVSPMANAAPSVYDTVVARLDRDMADGWDEDEMLRGFRYYLLTLTCLPFARAVESTVVPALAAPPASPTTVVIDDGTSASGWALDASDPGATGPTVVSGEIQVAGDIDVPGDFLKLVRTGAVAMGATPYLKVEVALDTVPAFGGAWRVEIDGAVHEPVSVAERRPATTAVAQTAYFDLTGESFTEAVFYYDFHDNNNSTFTFSVLEVARTDTIGGPSTTRQQSRLVTVSGSVPTQAAIRLFDATPADLGRDILVYTSRSLVDPSLRQWLDSSTGPTPAPDTAVSGNVHVLDTPSVFLIPAEKIRPGTHALVARIAAFADGTLTWSARMTTLGGAATVGSDVVVSGEVVIPQTPAFAGVPTRELHIFDVAGLILPVVEVEGSGYAVELTLTGTADLALDDAWLFSLDDGALTWVEDDEGLDWIEIRSPELGAARPSVWGGRNAVGTGASCIDWKCRSFGSHRFEPGEMQILTITPASLVSQAEIESFPRFHSNVRGGATS